MKTPGPDHPISVTPAAKRWRAKFNDHVIADSAEALVLQEASYPPVVYFPRDDVAMEYMTRTARSTHCPYKGDAAYYSLTMDGDLAENAVWTYETPYPAMTAITGRLAFYPDVVELYEVDEATVNPHAKGSGEAGGGADIDAVIQHTDSGSGVSQRAPWPTTVRGPDDEAGVT